MDIVDHESSDVLIGFVNSVTATLSPNEAITALDEILHLSLTLERGWKYNKDVVTYLVERKRRYLRLGRALHDALDTRNTQCVQLLLDAEADVNFIGDGGWTPLFYAADNPHLVKLLLEAGAKVNLRNYDGHTALTHNCMNWSRTYEPRYRWQNLNKELVIKMLLATGAGVSPVEKQNPFVPFKQNETELTRVVLWILAAGATRVLLGVYKPITIPILSHVVVDQTIWLGLKVFQLFPPGWEDLELKNQCRKVIRRHLLTHDPHTNLFILVPQLEMTNQRRGLPTELVSYPLYGQSIKVDGTKVPFF